MMNGVSEMTFSEMSLCPIYMQNQSCVGGGDKEGDPTRMLYLLVPEYIALPYDTTIQESVAWATIIAWVITGNYLFIELII